MDRTPTRGHAALLSCACILSAISGTVLAAPDQTTLIQPDKPIGTTDLEDGGDVAESRIAQMFTYQGRLRQNGQLANGNYNINFGLYANAIGGGALANSGVIVVSVSQGVFTVDLPFGTNLFDGSNRWLQLTVNGSVLTPRQKINPTPFSFTSDQIEWPMFGSYNGQMMSLANTSATGVAPALFVRSDSTEFSANAFLAEISNTAPGCFSAAVRGVNNGESGCGIGVWGSHEGFGFGVYGTTVDGYAVVGQNSDEGGYLFYGNQPAAFVVLGNDFYGGVYASISGANRDGGRIINGTTGTDVTFANRDSQGVFAVSSTGSSYDSNAVRGVQSTPGNNDTPAIYGINNDSDFWGIGVRGDGKYQGVYGVADGDESASYYGVRGFADSGTGGTGYGIYGSTSGSGTRWAGYFAGNANVTGTLSKGAGSFKIDHPLDPYNRYLYHSFVESPEMMNIYNGQARIDANGTATVQMPDYFQALNRDFRYQLTPIGAPMPNLYIAHEMTEQGVFVIAGGVPGAKVSWQVTGVREDAFANANRIPVEEWKSGDAVGKLLHPESFGRGHSEGIDASREASEARKLGN